MALWKKIGLGMVALALGMVAVVAISDFSVSGECRNESVSELNAPGNAVKFVVFERDCGVTTGFSTQVSLLKVGETLKNEGGNIFIADTNHGRAPSGVGGGPEVRIKWVSDTHLQIHHHQFARVFLAEKTIGGVRIDYATFN